MSLKGSLQTVALQEVLNLLSTTGKSGEFQVSGSDGTGRLWFTEGRICGFEAGQAEEPFEAVFELMRIEDGEFTFAESERPDHIHPVEAEAGEVGPAVEAAEARLAEWREIIEVVPSLRHAVHLRTEAPEKKIVLDPEQWPMLVAVATGPTVGAVISSLGLRDFDGCRAMRPLVESSLVEVSEPVEAEEPVAAEEPVVEEPFGEEPVMAEPAEDAEPVAGYEDEGFDAHILPFAGEEAVAASSETEPADLGEVQPSDAEGDHYAALRAAMVEIGEDLMVDRPLSEDEGASAHSVYELEADPEVDGRAALQALLHEVAGPEAGPEHGSDDPVDALADRGPWTEHELSVMDSQGGWSEPGDQSNIVPFAPVHSQTDGEAGESSVAVDEAGQDEAEEAQAAEEPINRGLLLKFLSSVRN